MIYCRCERKSNSAILDKEVIPLKTLHVLPTFLLAILIACSGISFVYADELNSNVGLSLESKLEQLTTTVYCYCGCTRETIQQCVCGTSQQVENEFKSQLKAGETVEKIQNDYLQTYGMQYSALMPVEGVNILAYVMPVFIMVLLGGIVVFVLKSKMKLSVAKQPATSIEKNPDVSEEVQRQIEAEVERYKQGQ